MVRLISLLVLAAIALMFVSRHGEAVEASTAGLQHLIHREFVIQIPESGQFLPSDIDQQLVMVATAAKEMSELYGIEVVGHTDNFGGELENLLLSLRRAGAVGERLAELGIEDGLISFDGFGELMPVADNSTESGRNSNRRIVVRVAGRQQTTVMPRTNPLSVQL